MTQYMDPQTSLGELDLKTLEGLFIESLYKNLQGGLLRRLLKKI